MKRPVVARTLGFALLWVILSEGGTSSAWVGALTVAAAVWASLILVPSRNKSIRWTALPAFLVFFIAGSLRGGWLTAKLALRGVPSLSPISIELPMPFRREAPRTMLIGIMGLMPGTLSVDACSDRLCIHVLDDHSPAAQETQALIARLAALFGEEE